jgi:hypothetical protein
MADFEQLYKKLDLHMANNEEQRVVMDYHAGPGRARKEIAVMVCVATSIFIAFRAFAG